MLKDERVYVEMEEEAVLPGRAHKGDAGIDIYPVFEEDYLEIRPGEVELVGTGIKTSFSDEMVAVLKERSGLGSKGIAVRAGVIDSVYQGEWKVALQNLTDKVVIIAKYPEDFDQEEHIVLSYQNAVAQVLFMPVVPVEMEWVADITNFESDRGDNGFGSSDKH